MRKTDSEIFYQKSDSNETPDSDEKPNPETHYIDSGRPREPIVSGKPRLSDEEVFYGGDAARQRIKQDFQFNLGRIADLRSLSAVQREQLGDLHATWFEVIAPTLRPKAHDSFTQALIAPLTPEEHQAKQQESNQYLRETFGPRADAVRSKMQEIVNRDPRFAKELTESGAGSHPDVIKAFAEAAARALGPGE